MARRKRKSIFPRPNHRLKQNVFLARCAGLLWTGAALLLCATALHRRSSTETLHTDTHTHQSLDGFGPMSSFWVLPGRQT